MLRFWRYGAVAMAMGLGVSAGYAILAGEYKSGIIWPEPKVVTPGDVPSAPPSDAIVLFDGKDLSKWSRGENWEIVDGYAITRKSDITTKDGFGDCQFHIEFATPAKVSGQGQGRGNSGVYFMGRYEVQILDSFENKTYFDGQCGSIYKQTPPMVNACKKPGEWQTYDIVFEAPRFGEDGKVTKPAYLTVFHNGVLVQNHYELQGGTYFDRPASYSKHPAKLPITLQFHGNEVKYRNIWLREITPIVGEQPKK
ncbi:MAG: 3-keto-disaccharide hydrolase [Fimbriiglobus sp.]